MLNYNVNVYLRHTEMENMYIREIIDIVAQDTKAYTFKFTLYDDEVAYDLTGRNVYLITKSTSGTIVQDKCTVTDAKSGLAQITLPNDMFCEEGTYAAEVQIWEGTSRLTSLPFDYSVRLSLQTNRSVIADNRYSLLQEALENVAEADSVSTQAINTANQAKALADSQINTINTASQNAQEALDRATSVVTQEEFAEKVKLNGSTTNVNFKRNEIVQDGLLDVRKNITSNIDSKIVFDSNNFSVSAKVNLFKSTGNSYLFGNYYDGKGFYLFYFNTGEIILNTPIGESIRTPILKEGIYLLTLNCIDGNFELIVDNMLYKGSIPYIETTQSLAFGGYRFDAGALNLSSIDFSFVYNHSLATQEIQHNFSVLSNPTSISAIETTDSSSVKTSFLFATNTDNVQTRTGHTEEERYTALLKRFGKKYTSAGEDITVENGIENQRVLGCKITGQTVKNYLTEKPSIITYGDTNPIRIVNKKCKLDANKTYKIIYNVTDFVNGTTTNTCTARPIFRTSSGAEIRANNTVPITKNGFNIATFNLTEQVETLYSLDANTISLIDGVRFKISDVFIGEELSNINDMFYGLSSTQATIYNNGLKYSFYLNNEDKLAGKVIDLGGLEGARNTFEIKADGSGVYTQNFKIDGVKGITFAKVAETTEFVSFGAALTNAKAFNNSSIASAISNVLNVFSTVDIYNATKKGFSINSNGWLYLSLTKAELATLDSVGVNKWLSDNGFILGYQLATSIVTYIDKSLVPAILTQATNTFQFEDAVKPSSVEITVPIDRVGEHTQEIDGLQKTVLLLQQQVAALTTK